MEERWYCIAMWEMFTAGYHSEDECNEYLDDPEIDQQYANVCGDFVEYGELGFQLATSPIDALERFAVARGYKNATECFYLYEACDPRFGVTAFECPCPELDPEFEENW